MDSLISWIPRFMKMEVIINLSNIIIRIKILFNFVLIYLIFNTQLGNLNLSTIPSHT
jgi:hypothetical protein